MKARPGIGDLRGLGPKSQSMLAAAGITTVAQLRRFGSVRAYAKVRSMTGHASLNLLWALEGALTDLPWQVVAKEHRLSLLLALEALDEKPLRSSRAGTSATRAVRD